ncbi:hypothetical protein B0H19DRAFT_965143, partial [Mycena capillaripes]
YERHLQKKITPSLDEVHYILRSTIEALKKVYIIIDAVDEYPEDKWLILQESLTAMGGTVNLLLTSRHRIQSDLSLSNPRTLEIRADDQDVWKYIDEHIRKSKNLSRHVKIRPELQEEICSKIQSTIDGM